MGRGSLVRVKVQLSRGVLVAVKQFLPRTVIQDVVNEVEILCQLNYPYFFGAYVTKEPYLIVTQFEGILGDDFVSTKAWTVWVLIKTKICEE